MGNWARVDVAHYTTNESLESLGASLCNKLLLIETALSILRPFVSTLAMVAGQKKGDPKVAFFTQLTLHQQITD